MRKVLCGILSLAIFISSLPGCATPPPIRPKVTGPQVYGYILNQQIPQEQLLKLTKTSKAFVGSLRLYKEFPQNGSELGLYIDSNGWLDTVSSTSREFYAESDCQVALEKEEAQLKRVIDDFNLQQARPDAAPRQTGDVFANRLTDACQRIGGQGPGAEAFHYTLWATLQTETEPPQQDFPRKVEAKDSLALGIAVGLLLVVAVVVLFVVSAKDGHIPYVSGDSPDKINCIGYGCPTEPCYDDACRKKARHR